MHVYQLYGRKIHMFINLGLKLKHNSIPEAFCLMLGFIIMSKNINIVNLTEGSSILMINVFGKDSNHIVCLTIIASFFGAVLGAYDSRYLFTVAVLPCLPGVQW